MVGKTVTHSPPAKKPKPTAQEKRHLDELLDEALDETFPASDAPALTEPAPEPAGEAVKK